ncbi:hypothetical protein GCM10020229_82630 [Kitasatospora albolonga]
MLTLVVAACRILNLSPRSVQGEGQPPQHPTAAKQRKRVGQPEPSGGGPLGVTDGPGCVKVLVFSFNPHVRAGTTRDQPCEPNRSPAKDAVLSIALP